MVKRTVTSIVKNIENIYFGIHIQVHYTLWICPLDLNTYISVQPEKEGSKLVLESCFNRGQRPTVSLSRFTILYRNCIRNVLKEAISRV